MRRSILLLVCFFLLVTVGRAQDSRLAVERAGAAPSESQHAFDLSSVTGDMIAKFSEAWIACRSGVGRVEAVVLILRDSNGSFNAELLPPSNEYMKFTFVWNHNTVAVAHTHPKSGSARPVPADIQLADRFDIPMFTLTLKGMYMYDPKTKKTSVVHDGLDWLRPSKWERYSRLAVDNQSAKH
jgi:hypothetical protein